MDKYTTLVNKILAEQIEDTFNDQDEEYNKLVQEYAFNNRDEEYNKLVQEYENIRIKREKASDKNDWRTVDRLGYILADLDKKIEEYEDGNIHTDIDLEIEDAESFLSPEQQQAIEIAQKLATDPKKAKMFGPDPQKELNKAYGQKMIEISNKIKSIKI